MTDTTPAPAASRGAFLGWRAQRRPQPAFAHVLGAAAGAFVVIALVAFVASIDSEDPTVSGTLLSLLLSAAAFAVGLRGPGPLRSACVTVLVLTVPLVWVFALVGDGSGDQGEARGILLLTLACYTALYLLSWTKGRAVFLAGALIVLTIWVASEVAGGGSGAVPFGETFGESSNDFGVAPGVETDNSDSTTSGVIMVLGISYLVIAGVLDQRKLSGAATPFIAVGSVIAIIGGIALASPESGLAAGVTAVLIGAAVGMVGAAGPQRRATTWLGVLTVFGGIANTVPKGVTLTTARSLQALPTTRLETSTIAHDLAYILYTSGSTGRPKGVMLSHENGCAFAMWAARQFRLEAHDEVSQFAPLIFDLSTFDLFSTAAVGATVHLVPHQTALFPKLVKRFLSEHAITVLYAVPSLLTALVERGGVEGGDLPSLRTVLFAGEVFPSKHLASLMRIVPHASFANLYGPTETNVCTFHPVAEPPEDDGPPVPIGTVVDGDEAYVVRDDRTLAAPGEVGELLVRGATVMQGYWGDPERTAASLIPNPFRPELRDPVYRTGDLVIADPCGVHRLVGRRDSQVKRRGYRIELGEIEAALVAHPAVRECAVTAATSDGSCTIRAHVVTSRAVSATALTNFCLERIPRYMLPDEMQVLTELPKTATGKIDRYALEHATNG